MGVLRLNESALAAGGGDLTAVDTWAFQDSGIALHAGRSELFERCDFDGAWQRVCFKQGPRAWLAVVACRRILGLNEPAFAAGDGFVAAVHAGVFAAALFHLFGRLGITGGTGRVVRRGLSL